MMESGKSFSFDNQWIGNTKAVKIINAMLNNENESSQEEENNNSTNIEEPPRFSNLKRKILG